MNCIEEDLIQRYIDGEVEAGESEQIERHLAECLACAVLVDSQKQLALSMKSAINEFAKVRVLVPPFVVPTKRKPALHKNRQKLAFALSAACLLAFFVMVWDYNKNEQLTIDDEITILGQTEWQVDANQPIGQQGLKVNLIDPEGNITEYVLQ